jgi:cytochrome c
MDLVLKGPLTMNIPRTATPLRCLLASSVLIAGSALATGDARHGSDVFAEHCSECHSAKEGKNKKGPSLFSGLGRKAATVPDFSYSDALKASGIVWSAEQLDTYLALPKKAVPGGKMKYDGLPDPAARADLIAYLATLR